MGYRTFDGMLVREIEAQLPSIRVVFAATEAAQNAGLDLASIVLLGDGHLAGTWLAHVYGVKYGDRRPADFVRHWKRLVSGTDYHVIVQDAVTEEPLAYG